MLAIETADVRVEEEPALSDSSACRAYGDRWLADHCSALLVVPSVIVPESCDVLINPAHPDASGIHIVHSRPWTFDPRLF